MYDFVFFILLYSFQILIINVYIYNSEVMKMIKEMTLGSS